MDFDAWFDLADGLDVHQVAAVCNVHRTTALRWRQGNAPVPAWARRVLALEVKKQLPAPWQAWRVGRDGLLYAPDLKRGFLASDLYQLHWLQQSQAWRLAGAATRAQAAHNENGQGAGAALPVSLRPGAL